MNRKPSNDDFYDKGERHSKNVAHLLDVAFVSHGHWAAELRDSGYPFIREVGWKFGDVIKDNVADAWCYLHTVVLSS